VRKEFVQRVRTKETERQVTLRADKWLRENLGKLPTMTMPLTRAIELYIEDRQDDDIRPVSLKDDKYVSELLKSALGTVRIDALDAFGIELALKPWRSKARTAKKIRDFGRKLYKWLAKRGWVDVARNPFQQARAVKYAPSKWQEPITPAHFAKAMEHVTRDDYRAVLLLLRWTGMRPKSARELTWPEVEERDGRMWIRKVSAKTTAGTRPVLVRKEAAEAIRALPKSSVFVFPSAKTGKPYNETTIMGAWRDAQTAAGLTPRPLYDLKHLRVTELAEEFDDVTVAYAVGLDSADAIRNNYRQIDGERLAKRIESL
jgi:integrase